MDLKEIYSVIGQVSSWLISGAAGAASLRVFGGRWLENIFSKDLEAFKAQKLHEFDLLLTRKTKWHQVEHEVLSNSWIKLKNAQNKLKQAIPILRRNRDFTYMNDLELQNSTNRLNFTEDEKDFFLNQADKNKAYERIMDFRSLIDAQEAFSDYRTYFEENRIFLSPEVKQKFLEVSNYIISASVSIEMSLEINNDLSSLIQAYKTENEKVTPLIDEIESIIQKNLFP